MDPATQQKPAQTNTPAQSTSPATSEPAAAAPAATPATPAKPAEAENFLNEPAAPAKPAEGDPSFAAAADVEEVEYELELPEDSLVPDEEFDAIVNEAKEKGLSKDEADARLKLLDKGYKNGKDAFLKAEGKRLLNDLLQDEMFNTKEKQTAAKANIDQVYAAYKDPDFMKFVKENPTVGNNKHFVKFMAKLGESLKPAGDPPGGTGGTPPTPPKKESNGLQLQDMYPSQFEEKK